MQTELSSRPRFPVGEIRSAAILFADVCNSTEIANILPLGDYDAFLNEFQVLMREAIDEVISDRKFAEGDLEASVRGDEAFLIIYGGQGPEAIRRNLQAALDIGLTMKRKWVLSSFNRGRTRHGKGIEDIGIGVHLGEVVVGVHPARGQRLTAEGWAISLAKKVEGLTRQGEYSRILVTERVYRTLAEAQTGVYFAPRKRIRLASPDRVIATYEIKGFSMGGKPTGWQATAEELSALQRMLETNPYDLWLAVLVGNLHYAQNSYREALNAYRMALETEPDFASAMHNAALCRYHLREYDKADALCRRMLQSTGTVLADVWYLLGLIAWQRGQLENEQQAYHEALAAESRHCGARLNLIESLLQSGQYTEAVDVAADAPQDGIDPPDQAVCAFLHGLSLALAGRDCGQAFDRAEQLARDLSEGEPVRFDLTDCLALAREHLSGPAQDRALASAAALKACGP